MPTFASAGRAARRCDAASGRAAWCRTGSSGIAAATRARPGHLRPWQWLGTWSRPPPVSSEPWAARWLRRHPPLPGFATPLASAGRRVFEQVHYRNHDDRRASERDYQRPGQAGHRRGGFDRAGIWAGRDEALSREERRSIDGRACCPRRIGKFLLTLRISGFGPRADIRAQVHGLHCPTATARLRAT
jgi:hypothetical protein